MEIDLTKNTIYLTRQEKGTLGISNEEPADYSFDEADVLLGKAIDTLSRLRHLDLSHLPAGAAKGYEFRRVQAEKETITAMLPPLMQLVVPKVSDKAKAFLQDLEDDDSSEN